MSLKLGEYITAHKPQFANMRFKAPIKNRSQPRKAQTGENLENTLGLERKGYDKIFSPISLRLMEIFIK